MKQNIKAYRTFTNDQIFYKEILIFQKYENKKSQILNLAIKYIYENYNFLKNLINCVSYRITCCAVN